jgi:Cd2+/Zn2+-exporting ATPase
MLLGLIAMRDEPRADAVSGIRDLRRMGLRILSLSGDNARTAQAIAAALDVEVKAELLPADKLREITALGPLTAMVGDGINDSPALAAAAVGIAMGSGTDVALEAADAALLNNRVGDVASLISLARATLANIHQNVGIALGLKGLFLVTTIAGYTGLWIAVLADTGATVIVTLNALRLLRQGRTRT